MRILLTGEAGQLATRLAASLSAHGDFEVATTGYHLHLLSNPSSHHPWPELDVADGPAVHKYFSETKPDLVIHFAAITGTDKCDEFAKKAIDANLLGTHNVLTACAEIGAKLIYLSTTATYDPHAVKPYFESSPQRPSTLYGITKYAGELLVRGQSRVKHLIVRPCFIYGDPPRDHSSQLCRIAVHQVLKMTHPDLAGPTPVTLLNPTVVKDYMRVEDFTAAMRAIVLRFTDSTGAVALNGEVLNVSGMDQRPVGQYFSELERALGLGKLDMKFEPAADYLGEHIVDSHLLRAMTGWKPATGFSQGIALLAESAKRYVKECVETGGPLLYK